MFRDTTYVNKRSREQKDRFMQFLDRNKGKRFLAFEIGSGPHVQTIRINTRMVRKEYQASVVRINPHHFKIKAPGIGLGMGALEALEKIDRYIS
ncbi:MAG: hypothetical protein ACPGJS_04640 [Flammeovirgaceae bacterium]